MTRREQRIFECLADTLLAPAPPLPPVAETDAVAVFSAWLERFPIAARFGLRAMLIGIELHTRFGPGPWHSLSPGERRASLDRLARRVPNGPLLVDALRAAVGSSYYGDRAVAARLGYTRPGGR